MIKPIDLLEQRFKVYRERVNLFKIYKTKVKNNPQRYSLKVFNEENKFSFEFYDKGELISTLPLWNLNYGNESTKSA